MIFSSEHYHLVSIFINKMPFQIDKTGGKHFPWTPFEEQAQTKIWVKVQSTVFSHVQTFTFLQKDS